MILDFALALSSGSNVEGVGEFALLFGFSCWVGVPLVALGQVRVFRPFPRVTFCLWAIGLVVEAALFYGVFIAPQGSTAGLAMLFVPLYLLVLYGVACLVLGSIAERWK